MQLFQAMADWQLDEKEEARQLLKVAQAKIDQQMESPPNWDRRAKLEQYRREAEELIRPTGAKPNN